jgi:hypothetical protein
VQHEMFVIVALLSASWILTCMSIILYRRMAAPNGVHAIVLISVLLTVVATHLSDHWPAYEACVGRDGHRAPKPSTPQPGGAYKR